MLRKITALLVILLFFGMSAIQAQDYSKITKPNIMVSGDETNRVSEGPIVKINATKTSGTVFTPQGLVWDWQTMTSTTSSYDLQSNASTQQIWVQINTPDPDFVHAVFTNSVQDVEFVNFTDRASLYLGSADGGDNWFEGGQVPVNLDPTGGSDGRSGFPAIYGLSSGAAVILNHNNSMGHTPNGTRTTLWIDSGPFDINFTEHDPGTVPPAAQAIWPRFVVNENDNIIFASTVNGGDSMYVNTFNTTSSLFSGWQVYDGDQAETHGFAVSDGGIIGLAHLGQFGGSAGDVFYKQSTDEGLTWTSQKVFDCPTTESSDTLEGSIRGVSMSFHGEDPCVTYELVTQLFDPAAPSFFPGVPNSIEFWSPNVNGGVPVTVADSSNVPYQPYLGTNDVQQPLCRPVIGRSNMYDWLFLAFVVATENVWPGTITDDSTTYCAVYFTYSSDGGANWEAPMKITPDTPLRDFRYPSIAPVNPVFDDAGELYCRVYMSMQGDSIPGSTVNGSATMPKGATAQYYFFTTDVDMGPNAVGDPTFVNSFNLEQNYPNPFNPSTKINYTLAERSNVTLKVYDVLGKEVANLVNSSQDAGSHSVNFDASNLASGLYIYTLQAGNFISSKKMMLLK